MTIFRKSLVTLSFSVFVLTSLLIGLVMAFMHSLYYETNAAALGNAARTIYSMIPTEPLEAYFASNTGGQPSFIPLARQTDTGSVAPNDNPVAAMYRFTLINVSGDVLWDSQVEGRMVNHLDREEVQTALEGKEGRAMRNSVSIGERQVYAALPVFRSGGEIAGVFRLSITIPGFWRSIAPAALSFLCFAALFALIVFWGIWRYSQSLSRSLIRLVDMAMQAGEPWYEELPPPAGINPADEAGELLTLERALRGMTAELQRRLEDAKTESSRLQTIINGMSGAVLAIDSRLNLLLLNPPARSLFKLEGRTLWGLSLLEATHSTELEWAARKVLAAGKPEETELRLYTDNTVRRFQVFTAPLPSFNGEPESAEYTGAVMVLEDVTRLFRLEQIRKDFVSNVSHELRTPIQLIKGFSETLLDLPELNQKNEANQTAFDPGQIRRCVEIIHKHAAGMESLTSDLLTLASLEEENHSTGPSHFEELALAPLFDEALASVEPQAKKKKIAITVDCPEDIKAHLHGSFIIQALVNLFDNAIKYSAAGSRVWAKAYLNGTELVLEVKDEGIGISVEHLKRIFERFYRVDRSRSPRTRGASTSSSTASAAGTGLGLSIVRHIALLHDGTVEAESRAGEGSLFRIRLPLVI